MSDQKNALSRMMKINQESIANTTLLSLSNIMNAYGDEVEITDLISTENAHFILKYVSDDFISDYQGTYQTLVDNFPQNTNSSNIEVFVDISGGTAQDVFVYQNGKKIDFDLTVNDLD